MESLPSELRENEHKFLAKHYSEKPLGIKRHSTNDVFIFKVGHDLKMILTKQFLLSKVCYPMGWLPSTTLALNYNMQSSWSQEINYDEKLSDGLMEAFLKSRTKIHHEEKFD